MNPAIKGAIAFGSVVGTGGLSYGIYSTMKSTPEKVKTYGEVLESTLLTATDDSEQANWQSRLTSLKEADVTKLVEEIKELKTKNEADQWKKLRTWCQNIVKTPSKDKQSQEFQNIQSYCTFSVKEKLGNNVIPNEADPNGKWTAAHTKLSKITGLNDELTKAKNLAVETGKTKVKDWCVPKYSEPFKGETDPDFVLAKQVCVSD